MNGFSRRIAPYVEAELAQAASSEAAGRKAASFAHLERAHVLGQASTFHHVRIHVLMLAWALRQHEWKEMLGQILRIVGAATKTALGWVPKGNTGGANISPFRCLPIAPDLDQAITRARQKELVS